MKKKDIKLTKEEHEKLKKNGFLVICDERNNDDKSKEERILNTCVYFYRPSFFDSINGPQG